MFCEKDNLECSNMILEDQSRLTSMRRDSSASDIVKALSEDKVVLIQDVSVDDADRLMLSVATHLGLAESLEVQSCFASSLGHRENVSRYYMSVNKRRDYEFVPPHSEGSSFTNIQLASLYCYENSTDGGETILMNVGQSCKTWEGPLRQKVVRGKSKRELTPAEIHKLKVMARLNMPKDSLRDDDEIIKELQIDPNFTLYEVLVKPTKTYSVLLKQEVYAYWDSIECIDYDSCDEFYRFLKHENLLKLPAEGIDVKLIDQSAPFRIGHYGVKYGEMFKCRITRKLLPGDLIFQNNLTWCHSGSGWTPGSGTRKVVAAFA